MGVSAPIDAQQDEQFAIACVSATILLRFASLQPAKHWTEKDQIHNWHYEVEPANRPGKPVVNEKGEQICNENNGPFGSPAVSSTR